MPDTRYAKTPSGAHVAYQVRGDGPVDLVILSGGFVPMDSMDEEPGLARFLRRLASFARVITFDCRGAGLSDPFAPAGPPMFEQWDEDIVAVLDAAGSDRAAVLATSFASLDAIIFAARHPERTSALVLSNGSARMLVADDYPFGAPLELAAMLVDVNTQPDAVAQGFDVLELVAPSAVDDPAFRSWWNRAGNRGMSPAVAQTMLRTRLEGDVRELLPDIDAPTLVIHSRDSQFIPVEHGRFLAAHINGARYLELPIADLLTWLIEPDPVIDEIDELLTGVRHGLEPDRVLVTVLFTDIVGSTSRLAEIGERRWRDVLDQHDELLRRELQRFGGREVKTTGDGILATFDAPAKAVRCAAAMRDAAREAGVEIRAGIHVGEVEIRGDDIGGMAVHIGQRVCASAGPSEVYVSRTITDLVAGSGIAFESRGDHELKGVPGAWQLFVVTG